MTITLDGSQRKVQLAGEDLDSLRLAYAQHVYRQQGATVERSIVLTGGWQTSKETAYVEATRARHGTSWFIARDDLGAEGQDAARITRLAQQMCNSRAQTPSLAHPELPDPEWGPGFQIPIAPEIAFKGSSENVVGITAVGGRIQAWYGTTEAGVVVEGEASDTTFSHGYVGIEGTNDDAYGETKYRAAQYETAAEREAKERKEREEREARERKEREEREAKEKREQEERKSREADEREYCKSGSSNKHCYALLNSDQTYEGTWVDMLDSDAAVYEHWGDMQNETWAQFAAGEWVEDGATLGYVGGYGQTKHVSLPVWFYAGEYPAGEQNYYEFAYEYGPALGNWYYMQEQDEGNGTWCAWLQGGEANCVAGRPLYTSNEQAGLEVATENPYNYGTAFAWGMNLGSGSWSGWANPNNYYTETPTGEKYCTIPVEWNPNTGLADPGGSSDYAAGVAFGVPNGNPSCESNGGDAIMAGPAPTPFGGSLASTPAEGPVPSSYTPPSGPTLKSAALGTIASEVAGEDGDAAVAPSTMMAVQTSLEKAISATEPSTVLPTTRTESQTKLLKSTTDLVVLHGQFSVPNAPRPPGEPAPSGSVLELIIDAHTQAGSTATGSAQANTQT